MALARFQSTRPRGARRRVKGFGGFPGYVSIHAPTRGATRALRSASCRARCFNPRAHAGRDPQLKPMRRDFSQFQSTRPRGARPLLVGPDQQHGRVSIHAPTRGATIKAARKSVRAACFNPRAHAGRDAVHRLARHRHGWFQSTRPRGARRLLVDRVQRRAAVSIHAPTRGATGQSAPRPRQRSGFNPRAHAGRDRPGLRRLRSSCCFNPRAHAGRDVGERDDHRPARRVSIHAPTRGATPAPRWSAYRSGGFNPRAHAGRDRPARPRSAARPMFQSTRPRGARLLAGIG